MLFLLLIGVLNFSPPTFLLLLLLLLLFCLLLPLLLLVKYIDIELMVKVEVVSCN